MSSFSHSPEVPTCPSCFRVFKTTQGANAHISTSLKCKAYNKGKNPEQPYLPWSQLVPQAPVPHAEVPSPSPGSEFDEDADSFVDEYPDTFEGLDDLAFELPPGLDPWMLAPNTTNEGGPSSRTHRTFKERSRVSLSLVEPEDHRHKEQTPVSWGAGHVFKVVPPATPEKTIDSDGDTSMDSDEGDSEESCEGGSYRPFTSELDWRIAQWAVADSASHAAFDRFLNIPGVSIHVLDAWVVIYSDIGGRTPRTFLP